MTLIASFHVDLFHLYHRFLISLDIFVTYLKFKVDILITTLLSLSLSEMLKLIVKTIHLYLVLSVIRPALH